MEINPKYEIGQNVQIGPHKGQIIGLIIKPNNTIVYQISYWNSSDQMIIESFYDFEIEPKNKMGFH